MKRLAILGAGGHAKVVADAAIAAGWESVAFFDDAWPALRVVGSWPISGAMADLMRGCRDYDGVVIGIGDNHARLQKHAALTGAGAAIVAIVHPAATVSPHAAIGAGTVVCAGAVINPFARIGISCIVNTCASVDHDCDLADGVHVSPGAHLGGGVRVGERSWIGIGASVKHDVAIGARVMVGAGAVVVNDIAEGLTVVGVPARPVQC